GVKPAPISKEQAQQLRTECAAAGVTVDALVSAAKVPSLEALPAAKFDGALDYIKRRRPKAASAQDDEVTALRRIDQAPDRDAAAEILDAMRDSPIYAKASEAFGNRWGER